MKSHLIVLVFALLAVACAGLHEAPEPEALPEAESEPAKLDLPIISSYTAEDGTTFVTYDFGQACKAWIDSMERVDSTYFYLK